jgi:3-oxoacyl-[acyl-carrier-protein] synthase-3
MAIDIIGTGRNIPLKKVTNDELSFQIDTNDEWIRSHTGIGSRYLAGEDTACSDLAIEAAKNALAMANGYTGEETADRDKAAAEAVSSIDVIIVATVSGDYVSLPSTACIVQDKLGVRNAAAMDILAGCTGFVYGLDTAAGLLSINKKRKRALVIGSEILSKIVNWNDRSLCVLFGDGAGAAVLEQTENQNSGIMQSILYADGSGYESLIIKRGGTRSPFKTGEVIDTSDNNKFIAVDMNGQEVYNFAVKALTDIIKELLESAKINIDDVTRIIPHQANIRIVQAAAKRLHIPMEKFYLNIEKYAKTSSASIPIALDEMNRNGHLKKGDLILIVGFGGGLTYGGSVIIW